MGQDKVLMAKYNSVIARNKELEEILNHKKEQWSVELKERKTTEKITRDFCEQVLATNENEMNLGKGKPWGSVPINDLLKRAQNSYVSYRKQNAALLKSLTHALDKERQRVRAMEEKVELMQSQNKDFVDSFQRQISEVTEDEDKGTILKNEKGKVAGELKVEGNDLAKAQMAHFGMSASDKKVNNNNNNNNNKELSKNNKTKQKKSKVTKQTEERKDKMGAKEIKFKTKTDFDSAITAPVISVISNKKNEEERKLQAMEIQQNSGAVCIRKARDIADKLGEKEQRICIIIGETGISENFELTKEYNKRYPKFDEKSTNKNKRRNRVTSSSTISNWIRTLYKNGIINKASYKFGKGENQVFWLTTQGEYVYNNLTNKLPVSSEYSKIISAHDSVDHGYGIKNVAKLLENKNIYQDIRWENRQRCTIKTPNGKTVIPDIIAIKKTGEPVYFEYETGSTSRDMLKHKLSKLKEITDTIIIVANSTTTFVSYTPIIQEWISLGKTHNKKEFSKDLKILCVTSLDLERVTAENLSNGNYESFVRYLYVPYKSEIPQIY